MYLKGVLGGLGGAVILNTAYFALKVYDMYVGNRAARARIGLSGGGLGAVAGGLSFLLRDPVFLILALVGFWLGFYLMAR